MPVIRKRRALFILPLIVLLFSILGGIYGSQVPDGAISPENDAVVLEKDLGSVTRLYSVLQDNYADPVTADKAFYKGAIPGMLHTLDPHSNFFDPTEFQLIRDEQRGTYFGVGMQVSSRAGKIVILAPFPGSPAYKAGLRPGDVIVSVNGKSTENLTTTDVAGLLKGPRGTSVQVFVSREGDQDLRSFTVIRDEINRKSVPDGFWVRPGIAYIKILNFGEGTARELDDNLKRFDENEMRGLILDLRGNPGGLLNAGVAVADHFLKRGQVIVSHRGRASAERFYRARNGSRGHEYPIVVLVDQSSASAAEIVSGALQDHDRAWILGTTTFGKGLVQTVYPLADNTALALTTAHFYTPSGRLIQRDYSNESFFTYYTHHDGSERNLKDVHTTDSGRTVYGGGGITPDEKYEPPRMDKLESDLYRKDLFSFTRTYFAAHSANLPQGWMPDEAVLRDLQEYLKSKGENYTDADFARDHDWIRRALAREMYIYAFNVDESDRVFAKTDPEVQKAVDAMPQANALLQGSRRLVVQR